MGVNRSEKPTPAGSAVSRPKDAAQLAQPSVPAATRREKLNRQRRERRNFRKGAEGLERQAQLENYKEIISSFTGHPVGEIHIHDVPRRAELVGRVFDLEDKYKAPLRADLAEFKAMHFTCIHAPGLHLFRDRDSKRLFLAVRIQPWASMATGTSAALKETLDCVILAHSIHYKCTSNAAQNGSAAQGRINAARAAEVSEPSDPGCVDDLRNHRQPRLASTLDPNWVAKPLGIMTTVAWHASQEARKTIVKSAPKPGTPADVYLKIIEAMPAIAESYCHGFATLAPIAAQTLQDLANEHNIPAFSTDTINETGLMRFWANSMSISSRRFANWSHRDYDACCVSYGRQFMASLQKNRKNIQKYFVDESVSQWEQRGGAFLVVPYGIMIDYDKMGPVVVDMFWRGDLEHLTMQSLGPENPEVMRHGTSIQITEKGLNALKKFRGWHDDSRVTSSLDRLAHLVGGLDLTS